MLQIPVSPDAISADWLSHVLGVAVSAVRVADAHAGTTGRAVLELEHDSPAVLPQRLFVKLPPTDPMQQEFVRSTGMGLREVRFYQQLSTEVPLRVPRCYHADSDDRGEEYIMLLEHLEDSGCTFHNASERYSLDYIRQVLAAFARLHSMYWASPRFDADLAWVEPPLQHAIAVDLIAVALEQHGDTMPDVFRAMGELYLAEADAIHALWKRGEATMIHGDVHDANMFFSGDEPGFLDWALLARGPAMRDVGYFLAGTLAPADQQAWGRELLDYYREQLVANGVAAPSIDELMQQYQWHAAYVWVGSAVTLAMGDAWQPVSYVMSSLEKLHLALDSLGSVEAIRSAL